MAIIKPLQSITLKNDNGDDTTYVVASAPAIVETTEPADVASFSDGAEGIPVSSLIADINPVQTGSGDPSPSNVRPITGWTGMNVVVSPTLDAQDGTTYPISWADEAGTVYGGTLNVTTGLLTVDRVIEEYDGTEDWKKSSTYNGSFYLNTGTQHDATNYPICSHATYNIYFPSLYAFGKFGLDGTGRVNLNVWIAAAGTSKDDFKAYLAAQKTAGTPLQVVTYLATPQTYQLTPQAVLTLLGQNNIWADTGDVEVAYCADTKMYIDKVIAAL